MYANDINNLAGKYRAGYGTPFDLEELAGTPGLDVNNITHVRIVDVVGSLGSHASHDSSGRVINDPYPTNFPTGGFDIDAVGVIKRLGNSGVNYLSGDLNINIYPNPVSDIFSVETKGNDIGLSVVLTTTTGRVLQQISSIHGKANIDIAGYPAGMYYLVIQDILGNKCIEKIIKY